MKIKTFQERKAEYYLECNLAQPDAVFMALEIAELRAALATQATPEVASVPDAGHEPVAIRWPDGRDAARLNAFIDWYLRGGQRSEIHADGHMVQTTRAIVIEALDALATQATPEVASVPDAGGPIK